MPTPFYHLALAEQMLADRRLPEKARRLLVANRPAFLLGNTAPDVQTLSGQARETTHFFKVPLRNGPSPHETMFAAHPGLTRSPELSPDQLAFLTGYICHLLLDYLWIRDLFQPIFGLKATWGDFPERLYLHNVLRVYLDRQLLTELPGNIAGQLRVAAPRKWLPFVADEHLRRWRDFLADQLEPGAESLTVAVFAERMGRAPADFTALLTSPAEMDFRIFSRLPRERLTRFKADGLFRTLKLTGEYLAEPASTRSPGTSSARFGVLVED